jgi:hypothetical protein
VALAAPEPVEPMVAFGSLEFGSMVMLAGADSWKASSKVGSATGFKSTSTCGYAKSALDGLMSLPNARGSKWISI